MMPSVGKGMPGLARRALPLALVLLSQLAVAQTGSKWRDARPEAGISAARTVVGGAPLQVFLNSRPPGARLAIARVAAPAETAIVVVAIDGPVVLVPTPGLAGAYELRVTADRNGRTEILLRQPLETTEPSATLAAPERVGRGQALPVRGIGPNGEQDRVTLVLPEDPAQADGPRFFPAENAEATLEAPDKPGLYELRYVMNAPLSGQHILARRIVRVE